MTCDRAKPICRPVLRVVANIAAYCRQLIVIGNYLLPIIWLPKARILASGREGVAPRFARLFGRQTFELAHYLGEVVVVICLAIFNLDQHVHMVGHYGKSIHINLWIVIRERLD